MFELVLSLYYLSRIYGSIYVSILYGTSVMFLSKCTIINWTLLQIVIHFSAFHRIYCTRVDILYNILIHGRVMSHLSIQKIHGPWQNLRPHLTMGVLGTGVPHVRYPNSHHYFLCLLLSTVTILPFVTPILSLSVAPSSFGSLWRDSYTVNSTSDFQLYLGRRPFWLLRVKSPLPGPSTRL